jgi:hypothetical protein
MSNPLDVLFVQKDVEFERQVEELKQHGWHVKFMGGDYITQAPDGHFMGPTPSKIWLFETEEIAWRELIKAGALDLNK